MPQACQEDVEEYFKQFNLTEHDDGPGFEYLCNFPGVTHDMGWFTGSRETGNKIFADSKARSALFYLGDEWDYAWSFGDEDN